MDIRGYLVRFLDGTFGVATRTAIPAAGGHDSGWIDIACEDNGLRPPSAIEAYDDSATRSCQELGEARHVALTNSDFVWSATCTWCGWNNGVRKSGTHFRPT